MAFPWSVVEVQGPENPVTLVKKSGEKTDLSAFVAESIPEANEGYYYTNKYFLGNGDMQTVLAGGEYTADYPVWYGRRFFVQNDGAQFSVDYCLSTSATKPANWETDVEYIPEEMPRLPPQTRIFKPEELTTLDDPTSTKPIMVTCHGLTGGSHENYIRAAACEIRKSIPDIDFAVLTSRGCNRTKITTPRLFNGAWTEDLRQLVNYIVIHQPSRPIFLVGYSLGASILANYLGQEGKHIPQQVKGTVVVSNPWDLLLCSVQINTSLMGKLLYSPKMTSNLCRLARNNREVLQQSVVFKANAPKLKQIKKMSQFDDLLTGPLFGFSGSGEYYRKGSSINRVETIAVPTLVLGAKDDPVSSDCCVPYKEAKLNPYLFLATTSHGGHLGWFPNDDKPRWFATVITKFVNGFLDRIDLSQPTLVPDSVDFNPDRHFFKNGRFQVDAGVGIKPKQFE